MLFDFLLPSNRGRTQQQVGPTQHGMLAFADGVNWNPLALGVPTYVWWDAIAGVWRRVLDSSRASGSMYLNNAGITINIVTVDVTVELDSGFSGGAEQGCIFQNGHEIKVPRAGRYFIVYNVAAEVASVSNKEMETHILINNVEQAQGSGHALLSPGGSGRPEMSGGSGTFVLAANDLISVGILDHTDNTDIVVQHTSLSIIEL